MKKKEYYRGRDGRKYGIWNAERECFQFGIAEDSPMLAEARLSYMIGDDARNRGFIVKIIPLNRDQISPLQRVYGETFTGDILYGEK